MQLHKTDPAPSQICHTAAQGAINTAERRRMSTAAPTPSAAQLFFAGRVLQQTDMSVPHPAVEAPGSIAEALQQVVERSFAEVLDEDPDAEQHEDKATDDFELRADQGTELLADEDSDSAEHEGDHANRHQ